MKVLLVIIYSIAFSCILGQEVIFLKEDITFRLNQEYFLIDGYYWFLNQSHTNCERLIYFPFGDTANTGIVDSIEVFKMPQGEFQNIRDNNKYGFSFNLSIAASDTAIFRIKYRQKIIGDSAKYILRSTQSWNRPLESAEYKLIVNKSMDIKRFSYYPDKVYTINEEKIYFWKRNDFMPECDLVFHF
jgi:hypothetical protein